MCVLCKNYEKRLDQLEINDVVFARAPLYRHYGRDDLHPCPLRFCPVCGRGLFPSSEGIVPVARRVESFGHL